MKPFLVLICSFALACTARGEKQHTKETGHAKSAPHNNATHGEHSTNTSAHQTTHNSPPVQHVQGAQHVAPVISHPAGGVRSGGHPPEIVQPGQPQPLGANSHSATTVHPAA